MKHILPAVMYYASYLVIFLFFFTALYIFRPYAITNYDKSKIVCQKNNLAYEFGPNLIFAIDHTLDPQTDKNVRKLCEYSIINDFQDTYKTPPQVNYRLEIANDTDGGWADTLLVSLSILCLGSIFIEFCKNKLAKEQKTRIQIIGVFFAAGVLIFFLLLRNPSQKLFCNRVIASNLANFRRSAYGYGLARMREEEPHLRSFIQEVYVKCLNKNNL